MLEPTKLFENSPFVVFVCEKTDKWSIVSVTENVKELIGYTSEEVIKENKKFLDLLITKGCEENKRKITENINNKVDNFNVELCKFRKKNNEYIWLEAYIHIKRNTKDELEGAFAYLIDITKHKKTEVELQESKERYRIISESTLDGIFIVDKTGTMIFANKGMYKLTGRSSEEMIGVHFSKYVPLSELPKYLLKLKNILLKQEIKNFVSKIIHHDGHLIDVEINGKLVKQDGNWVAQGSMRNITNRKEMLKNLKDSEERLRIIFENNPTPTFFGDFSLIDSYFQKIKKEKKEIFYFDKKLVNYDSFIKLFDVNKATISLYETKTKKKLFSELYKRFVSGYYDDFLPKLFNLWDKNHEFESTGSIKTLNNTKKNVIFNYSKLPNIKGKKLQFLVSINDTTEKKKIEKAFIRNQKLNTIGEIASSVAHDFNNSLQAMLGNLELAALDSSIKKETLAYIKAVKNLVLDASERVSVLQKFGGKKEVSVYGAVDIKKLIEDVVTQFSPIWKVASEKQGILMKVNINCEENLTVEGNAGELHNVIHNLLKNSIEAMPTGGEVNFEAKLGMNGVEVVVHDTGIGMDKKVQSKVFQAFYTTKGFELGRGLGLSGSYRIIKEHRGDIYILNSAIGKGTSIKIILPHYFISKKEAEVNIPKPNKVFIEEETVKGNLKILWVDDEPIIRTVVKQYLKLFNYRGDIAASGEEALELLEKNDYNLLITDIGMPEMNGWQLISNIKKRYSEKDIRIVVVSGWALEISEEEVKENGIYDILEKPIQFKSLEKIFNSLSEES